MSSQQAPAAEFSFPSLSGTQPSTGTQSNPFAVQPAPAATRPAPPQVQLQTPVQPQSTEPLTARSTVVHASSRTAAAQAPQQQQQGGSLSQQPAAAAQKPVPISQVQAEGRRNKVPLEKGFSQVSWLKLTKSGADLTGGQGRRRDITLEEVRQHRTADDAWMVLHGKVYNITPYLHYHPGGADILMKAAGKDGTSLFNKYHPWVNAHALLEKCLIGLLHKPDEEQPAEQSSLKAKLSQLFK